MSRSFPYKAIRWNKLYKFMAMFLLAFALFDITVVDFSSPQLCDESSSPTQTESGGDEDCFCCCSHVQPTDFVITVPKFELPLLNIPFTDNLPTPPAFTTYRPPKSA